MKSYQELIKIPTFKERFRYLKLDERVGEDTFGSRRYLNQKFYQSEAWKQLRNYIIVRDNGCDLGVPGYDLYGRIYIHHLNPITENSLVHGDSMLLDPDNLICVSFNTHQAIHFGSEAMLDSDPIERRPGDTCPWK